VFASLIDRPADIVRLSLSGDPQEKIGAFPRLDDLDQILLLGDGRTIVPEAAGHVRLMALIPGKDAAPLIQTAEDTAAPMATVGSGQVAFMIGPTPHETIAVADVDNGRIDRKIAPGQGIIESLAATPDGKTLVFAARGKIWSIPASGGETMEICLGDSALMEPSGRNLVVQRAGVSRTLLYRVPLEGGSEQEIPLDGSTPLFGLPVSLGALDTRGRLLVSGTPWDSWFNPLIMINTANGRATRVHANDTSDYHSAAWLPDGRIVAPQVGLRATLGSSPLSPEQQKLTCNKSCHDWYWS
jgi:hypothetical protein